MTRPEYKAGENGGTKMNQAIEDFVGGKRIALVGMSRNGKNKNKFGNSAYTVVDAVARSTGTPAPRRSTGFAATRTSALPEKVDSVLVVVPPQQAKQVLQTPPKRASATSGCSRAESPEVVALGQQPGLNLVSRSAS
jgi:hypothetical protein